MYSIRIVGSFGYPVSDPVWDSDGFSPVAIAASFGCWLGYSKSTGRLPGLTFVCPPHLRIVGDIHLHNRADLLEAVGISRGAGVSDEASQTVTISDSALVVAAYGKWGVDCPLHLEGEYSFCILDEVTASIFVCRDHVGSRPLYYWHESRQFLFATDPLALLRFPAVPRKLNRKKLAALAVTHGWECHADDTLHAGIRSLPPGSFLTVNSKGLEIRNYWVPDTIPDLVPQREEDAFEMARDLMFAAVRNRIHGKDRVALCLSGGLDSSAVAAVAAHCLAERNQSLSAFAGVIPDCNLRYRNDEREYIDEFRTYPNIEIHRVTADNAGPFDRLDTPGEFEACFPVAAMRYLGSALAAAAADRGADILMHGGFGELGPTNAGRGYFLDLAAGCKWALLASELKAWQQIRSRSGILNAFRPLAGEILELISPYGGNRRSASFLFTEDFRRECEAQGLRKIGWRTQRRRQLEGAREFFSKHATFHLTPAHTTMDRSFPLVDRRLLEFCISAPAHMKVRLGYSRYMVRRALNGILPAKIQWRTTKVAFSPDHAVRFNSQLPQARAFISSIGRRDPVRTILNVDRISELLQPVDPMKESLLARSLPAHFYLICFLRQFAEFRP